MKALCFLGIREAWSMVEQAVARLRPESLELLLVYVVNAEQRHDLLHLPGGLGRRHEPHESRRAAIDQADEQAGQTSLQRAYDAAINGGLRPDQIEQRIVRGRPEDVIVALAEAENCRMIVLRARNEVQVRAPRGPASVGHTARFILDHAPCDVLLLRS